MAGIDDAVAVLITHAEFHEREAKAQHHHGKGGERHAAIAGAIRAILADREEAWRENEDLRLTILGGEDAPGLAASLSLDEVKDIHRQNVITNRDRAEALTVARNALGGQS